MSEKKEEKRILDRFLSKVDKGDEQKSILDRFRGGNGPIRDFFKQGKVTEETLDNEQQKLAKSFREGIAEAIGIPVDHVDEISIIRWILDFTRSFVKPEHLKDTIIPPERRIREFGHEIGSIVRQAIERLDEEPQPKRLIEKLTNKAAEVVEKPKVERKGDLPRDISLG